MQALHPVIMPAKFVFGILNYFVFAFRAGPKSHSPAQDNSDIESNLIQNADSEASGEARILTPSPSPGTGNTDSRPCGSLNKLPLEVRMMVYTNVLCYDQSIKGAHRFLDRHPPIMVEDSAYLEAIDAALLRTCRAVYSEAIRILYRRNRFYFRTLGDIKRFAHVGLGNTPFRFYHTATEPSAAISSAPYGRLTMIRSLQLHLSSDTGNTMQTIWSSWCDFFYPPVGQHQRIAFPALEKLTLDLQDWRLKAGDASKVRVRRHSSHYLRLVASTSRDSLRSASPPGGCCTVMKSLRPASRLTHTRFNQFFEDGCSVNSTTGCFIAHANLSYYLQVKPFLQKLRPTGGLKRLALIGVINEQNLRDFKHGFVRQGGTFHFAASHSKATTHTTVTHNNLPEVSMYVRAIVEKDRALRTPCKGRRK